VNYKGALGQGCHSDNATLFTTNKFFMLFFGPRITQCIVKLIVNLLNFVEAGSFQFLKHFGVTDMR